jgi:hypothetical protein
VFTSVPGLVAGGVVGADLDERDIARTVREVHHSGLRGVLPERNTISHSAAAYVRLFDDLRSGIPALERAF